MSLAAAKESSVAAVLSEQGVIFALKEEPRKLFSDEKMFSLHP